MYVVKIVLIDQLVSKFTRDIYRKHIYLKENMPDLRGLHPKRGVLYFEYFKPDNRITGATLCQTLYQKMILMGTVFFVFFGYIK